MKDIRQWLLIALAFIVVGFVVFFRGSTVVFDDTLSIGNIFAGMLALTGFLFTARTFVTFKLNEVVYECDDYQTNWKAQKKAGAIKDELYDPLKLFDSRIHRATHFCFVSIFLLMLFATLPDSMGPQKQSLSDLLNSSAKPVDFFGSNWKAILYEAFAWLTISTAFSALMKTFFAFLKINNNIKSIIGIWEARAKQDKKSKRCKRWKECEEFDEDKSES